jgi:hypothetical protein
MPETCFIGVFQMALHSIENKEGGPDMKEGYLPGPPENTGLVSTERTSFVKPCFMLGETPALP